jgi:hypothetical protein
VSRICPVGDQALGQLLSFGGGQSTHRRRWHGGEIGIVGRLAGSQVFGVGRRIGIGVVPAHPGQVTPSVDRIAGGKPEEQCQSGAPVRRPPSASLVVVTGTRFAHKHHFVPDE